MAYKSLVLVAALLAGCGQQAAPLAYQHPLDVASVLGSELRPAGDGAGAPQPYVSELGNKRDSGAAKQAKPLHIKLPRLRQGLEPKDVASLAGMALKAMDGASASSGAQIAYKAIEKLNQQTGSSHPALVAGYAAAKATTGYDDAYYLLALTLDHVYRGEPESGAPLYRLALEMLGHVRSYQSGAQAGFAFMGYLRDKHPDPPVRTVAEFAYDQAKAAQTYQDAYRALATGFQTLAKDHGALGE